MFRSFLCAVVGLAVLAGSSLRAEEIEAKIKSVDTKTSAVTITVKDKDRQLPVAKDGRFLAASGKVLDKVGGGQGCGREDRRRQGGGGEGCREGCRREGGEGQARRGQGYCQGCRGEGRRGEDGCGQAGCRRGQAGC